MLGLVIEYPFYFFAFELGWKRTAYATVVANAFTSIVGFAVWYPIAFASTIIDFIGKNSWITPVIIIVGPLLTLVLNVIVEMMVVSRLYHVRRDWRKLKLLAWANGLSISVTIGGVIYLLGNHSK